MTASPINHHHDRRPVGNPGEEMLTLQEACRFLRIPEGTLRYWRHLGSGPRSFKIGLLWLTEQTNRPQDHR